MRHSSLRPKGPASHGVSTTHPSGPARRVAVAALVSGLLALLAALVGPVAPAASAADGGGGAPDAFTIRDPRITESSGLAASHAHPGVYWTHNDSPPCGGETPCDDGAYVYAVDSDTGETVATVTLRGIEPRDVEAIALGPGGDLYVGDIGDNFGGRWSEVWIYRFPEPERLRDTTVTPTVYTVRYADGPRDAESLMVHPGTGRVYIASKEEDGKGGVYAGPKQLSESEVNVFRRVAGTDVHATGGAFSPDGSRLVLRSYFSAEMYRWTDKGRPKPIDAVDVPFQGQGESVTFTPDGRWLMFGAEGSDSTVEPEELTGEVLPERARQQGETSGGSGSGGGGSGGGDSVATFLAEEDENLLVGAVVFVVAVGVWMSLRRLFRGRD